MPHPLWVPCAPCKVLRSVTSIVCSVKEGRLWDTTNKDTYGMHTMHAFGVGAGTSCWRSTGGIVLESVKESSTARDHWATEQTTVHTMLAPRSCPIVFVTHCVQRRISGPKKGLETGVRRIPFPTISVACCLNQKVWFWSTFVACYGMKMKDIFGPKDAAWYDC